MSCVSLATPGTEAFDAVVFLGGTSEQRLFPDWTMGFRDLTDHMPPGYTEFMNTQFTDAEFSRDPNRRMKLLLLFKKNMSLLSQG
jgi:hypothetical protein